MTVSELIAELQKMPQDYEVKPAYEDECDIDLYKITKVFDLWGNLKIEEYKKLNKNISLLKVWDTYKLVIIGYEIDTSMAEYK